MRIHPAIGPFHVQVDDRVIDLAAPDPKALEPYWLIGLQPRCHRFCGQARAANLHPRPKCDRLYTVAHHTLTVVEQLIRDGYTAENAPALIIAAALHDAHEPLISDIPRPFLRLLEEKAPGAFAEAETPIRLAIAEAAGLDPGTALELFDDPLLTLADWNSCHAEGALLLVPCKATQEYWDPSAVAKEIVREVSKLDAHVCVQRIRLWLRNAQHELRVRGRSHEIHPRKDGHA